MMIRMSDNSKTCTMWDCMVYILKYSRGSLVQGIREEVGSRQKAFGAFGPVQVTRAN